jgi:hypothetical protein
MRTIRRVLSKAIFRFLFLPEFNVAGLQPSFRRLPVRVRVRVRVTVDHLYVDFLLRKVSFTTIGTRFSFRTRLTLTLILIQSLT